MRSSIFENETVLQKMKSNIENRFTPVKGKDRIMYECKATHRGLDNVLRKYSKNTGNNSFPIFVIMNLIL